jgi:ADP-ribose pyrophosphatase YjhB (NUDIX family)
MNGWGSRVTPRKVLIYGTSVSQLLVFDEPDFPEVPLQVPGGTVAPDESILDAARREFHEETGLSFTAGFNFLGTSDYSFVRDSRRQILERSYFHIVLPSDFPRRGFTFPRRGFTMSRSLLAGDCQSSFAFSGSTSPRHARSLASAWKSISIGLCAKSWKSSPAFVASG